MAEAFKDTLQLPRTEFPMRANLAQREPQRLPHWTRLGLYERIQTRNAGGPMFVLHDGPPFTNGDVHIGTALNKVLKDVTLRFRSMLGDRTPYVPGWDCHGLPIEAKVSQEVRAEGATLTTAELRARCGAFAEGWIGRQREQFQRLGILADWAHEYRTMDPAYEAEILRTFAAFVERGLVYRSRRPVYWSIPFETALAEAEIEYREHVTPSIWVRFPVPPAEAAKRGLPADRPLSIVIWTTTPWTLPANLALAVHPDVEYVVAEAGGEYLLVARDLLASVASVARLAEPAVVATRIGRDLEHLTARHPFLDRSSPVVLADYVTTSDGTGVVHTAPGHGAEDYQTGRRYGLETYCPVGDDGRYLDDGRIPPSLVGLTTLETVEDLAAGRTSPANRAVLRVLDECGALLAKRPLTHSYPHCWRSKTPIVFRAVDQWFVALDGRDGGFAPRAAALAAIGTVHWIPASGENRIRGALESRPDWCVSRQRAWGVPIPAFYDQDRQGRLDAGVIRALADKVERHGSNIWFEWDATRLLEDVPLPAGWDPARLTPGRDTLDVWIDSGSSHLATLRRPATPGITWPADLYLEGSDQHRGWFQSSLWTGVIAAGGAPYRSVLTHGFIVGEDGRKISKSGQYEKPPTSDNYVREHGADVIRLWIVSEDFRADITLSPAILAHTAEAYRLFRNTLRFQVGNLFDFDPGRDLVPVERLEPLDRWALQATAGLARQVRAAFESFEYHRAYQLLNQYASVTLSARYHDILKDRLYTYGARSTGRRSAQTVLHHGFDVLCRLLAPVLVFTADEAWSWAREGREFGSGSVHLEPYPQPPAEWTDDALAAEFEHLFALRGQVNERIEALRRAGRIGKSLEAAVRLQLPPGEAAVAAERHRSALAELFIVSAVELEVREGEASIVVEPASGVRCPRCWRTVPALVPTGLGEVCPRCAEALSSTPQP